MQNVILHLTENILKTEIMDWERPFLRPPDCCG
jgi:hypothetical protein